MNKIIGIGAVVLLVAVGGFFGHKQIKQASQAELPLMEGLKSVLPKEAQDKILINQDKINLGKQYISTIYITEDDSQAPKIVSDFVFEVYSRLDKDEVKNLSAVNMVIYKDNADKTKARQYRILLGVKVAQKKGLDFWKNRDAKALFKWLTAECPLTSSVNLMEFCDISSSLKEI